MNSGVFNLIKTRRSIRNYTNKKVSTEDILELIQAAIYAPTGSNIQPWEFIIVESEEVNDKIKAFSPGLMGNPPNLIVVCRNLKKSYDKGGAFGRDELSIIDISMASQNILLLATEKGIATCIVKSFNKEAIEKILNVPDYISADIIISIGYSEANHSVLLRKSLNEFTYLNEWGKSINV